MKLSNHQVDFMSFSSSLQNHFSQTRPVAVGYSGSGWDVADSAVAASLFVTSGILCLAAATLSVVEIHCSSAVASLPVALVGKFHQMGIAAIRSALVVVAPFLPFQVDLGVECCCSLWVSHRDIILRAFYSHIHTMISCNFQLEFEVDRIGSALLCSRTGGTLGCTCNLLAAGSVVVVDC